MSCAGIDYDCLGECGDRTIQWVICTGAHKVESHKCGITGCAAKVGKTCTHIIPKYANCRGNYRATIFRCPARLKAQTKAWNEKVKKSQAKGRQPATNGVLKEELAIRHNEMEVENEAISWAKSPEIEFFDLSLLEDEVLEESQKSGNISIII